jgi:hypothetical protein
MEGIRISNKEYREREGVSSTELEEWRDIKGYEGRYQVSNLGRVRSLMTHISSHGVKHEIYKTIIFKPGYCGRNGGYECVGLMKDGKRNRHRIHRLVAEAFIPNPNNLPMVDHINRNKSDNRVENLRWCDGLTNRRNCDYNRFFTIDGETKILTDWCDIYKINFSTVRFRLGKGMDILSALTNPIMTPREARLCRKD